MNIATVWILVGYLHWNSGGAVVPPSHLYPTKDACEITLRATTDLATHSKLRCVETKVMVQK